jgi:hypothetical protein
MYMSDDFRKNCTAKILKVKGLKTITNLQFLY